MPKETFLSFIDAIRQLLPLSLPWPHPPEGALSAALFLLFFLLAFVWLIKKSPKEDFDLATFLKVFFCSLSPILLRGFNFWPQLLEFEAGWRPAAWGGLATAGFLLVSFNRPEGERRPPAIYFGLLSAWYLLALLPGVSFAAIIAASLIVIGIRLRAVWQISILVSAFAAFVDQIWRADFSADLNITALGIAPLAGIAFAFVLYLPMKMRFVRFSLKGSAWLGIILGLLVLFLTAHENDPKVETNVSWPVMGTVASLRVWDSKVDGLEAVEIVRATFDEVNNTLSSYDKKSELSQMNATAWQKPFVCGDLLWQNLKMAEEYYKLSGGALDVTIGPLMRLWGFRAQRQEEPSADEIHQALAHVGFEHVSLNEESRTVFFSKKGIAIDLGGIAKGYAVDLAIERLRQAGIANAVVDLGGNIFCIGKFANATEDYSVGVRNPWDKSKVKRYVTLNNRGIATSGNYERFVTYNGKRYPHIIDPRTGYPVHKADSVTVVSDSAFLCDVLSTALFVEGEEAFAKYQKLNPSLGVYILKKESDEVIEMNRGQL